MEFISATGYRLGRARTASSATSKLPFSATTLAPYISACESLFSAISPDGTTTIARTPIRAAYAAIEADVLPVDAHISTLLPPSNALATATTMPRSLKEPVGFKPSYLKYRCFRPRARPMLRLGTRGVEPSLRSTSGVEGPTGRRSRYRAMTPNALKHAKERG